MRGRMWVAIGVSLCLESVALAQDPPQELRWNLPLGKKIAYRASIETNAATTLGIVTNKVQARTLGDLVWELKAAEGPVVQTLERMRIRGEQDDTVFEIDTNLAPEFQPGDPTQVVPADDGKTPAKAPPAKNPPSKQPAKNPPAKAPADKAAPNKNPPPKVPASKQPPPTDPASKQPAAKNPPTQPPLDPQKFYHSIVGSRSELAFSPLGLVKKTALLFTKEDPEASIAPREKMHRQFSELAPLPIFDKQPVRKGQTWLVYREIDHPLVGKHPVKLTMRYDGFIERGGRRLVKLTADGDLDTKQVQRQLDKNAGTDLTLIEHTLKGVTLISDSGDFFLESAFRFSLQLDGRVAGQGYAQRHVTLYAAKMEPWVEKDEKETKGGKPTAK